MLPRGNELTLGKDAQGADVILSCEQRSTHLYCCGSTGTGKSKFLEYLIRQDIKNWQTSKCGLLLIDPHGSLYDSLIEWMAPQPLSCPVVPIDLRSNEWIVAYNMLRFRPGADAHVVATTFIQAMAHVWGEAGTTDTPLFARWADNILRTLYDAKQTLVETQYLLDHLAHDIRRALVKNVKSESVRMDWRNTEKLSPQEFEKEVGSTVNRLRRFLGTDMLRSMFGQLDVSLDMGKALDEGQIVLVNLAPKGLRVSEEDASLFATLLLNDVWSAAQMRGKGNHKPFYVYIDEFQRNLTPSIAQGLDQARGFGLHLTLAHQYPNQLLNSGKHGKAIYDSVLVNARSKAVFQVEGEDNLKPLALSLFMGVMNPDEIKHRLYSTKVMGHQRETRRSISRSSTVNESTSDGTGAMRLTDGAGDDKVSEYSSSSSGNSSGYSDTEMEVDAAVFGKELSSVQFRDLEEQKFRAMAMLFAQEQRACIARLADERLPVAISIPKVDSYYTRPDNVRRYIEKQAKKWQFLLPVAEAKAGLLLREDTINKMVAAPDGEPKTARRRI